MVVRGRWETDGGRKVVGRKAVGKGGERKMVGGRSWRRVVVGGKVWFKTMLGAPAPIPSSEKERGGTHSGRCEINQGACGVIFSSIEVPLVNSCAAATVAGVSFASVMVS